MKKSIKLLSVAVIGMFVLGGCGKAAVSNQEGSASSTSNQEAEVASMVTVNDTDGEVEVPLNPQKVVVFDMGSLDTINSLGKGDNIIGVPTKNLPAYLTSFSDRESAGGIKEPDLEKINQLQPDLIIISGRQADFKKELSAIAPTLYLAVDNADSWNSTKKNIETLGTIFEEEGTAKTKILELETAIAAVREKAENSGLKTLITLVNEGQLSAYGAGSRFGIIHDTFGFTAADSAIEVSTHGQSASFEYVLEKKS